MSFNTTEIVELMNAVPTILEPVPAIVIVVVTIMVTLSIGALVTGVLGAIVSGITKKINM